MPCPTSVLSFKSYFHRRAVTRYDSPNLGRMFYNCPRGSPGNWRVQCKYFEWADDVNARMCQLRKRARSSRSSSLSSNDTDSSTSNDEASLDCHPHKRRRKRKLIRSLTGDLDDPPYYSQKKRKEVETGVKSPSGYFTCSICGHTGRHTKETCPEESLGVCERVMREKGRVNLTSMHGVLFGLPGVGKSSLMMRLLGKLAAITASTGIAETSPQVRIPRGNRKMSDATIDVHSLNWQPVADTDDEAILLLRDLHLPEPPAGSLPLVHSSHQESPISNVDTGATLEVFRECLQKKNWPEVKKMVGDPWYLYLTDSGGQPEFQDLLPILASGPSIYILVFRLDVGLDEKYGVEYIDRNGGSIKAYKSSRTVLETILESLASVASTEAFDDSKEYHAKPRVLLVGTFKDKVSDDQVVDIDKKLQKVIRKHDRKEMVQYASSTQLIFTVDNTGSPQEKDVEQIRQAIYRLGTDSLTKEDYQVPTPCPWLVYSIIMRKEPSTDPVVYFQDCVRSGQGCGIDSPSEMRRALKFLHSRVGNYRHFQSNEACHLKLDQFVFRSPQYLFDLMTTLVVQTFTFDKINTPDIREKFLKRGIFSADVFKKVVNTSSSIFTSKELICLLEHLRIIVAIQEEEGTIRYFMPCALAHVEAAQSSELKQPSPVKPLLIRFDSGYIPRGAFGVFVAQLLRKERVMSQGLQWKLLLDQIFQDQITIRLTRTDRIVIQAQPTYFSITLLSSKHSLQGDKSHLSLLCSKIRREVLSCFEEVSQVLGYMQNCNPEVCFECSCQGPETTHPVDFHVATVEECASIENSEHYLQCSQNEDVTINIPDMCSMWLSEVLLCVVCILSSCLHTIDKMAPWTRISYMDVMIYYLFISIGI